MKNLFFYFFKILDSQEGSKSWRLAKRHEKKKPKQNKTKNKTKTKTVHLFKLHLVIIFTSYKLTFGGARGVMVTVVGHGHSNTSSNPGRDWLHFPLH